MSSGRSRSTRRANRRARGLQERLQAEAVRGLTLKAERSQRQELEALWREELVRRNLLEVARAQPQVRSTSLANDASWLAAAAVIIAIAWVVMYLLVVMGIVGVLVLGRVFSRQVDSGRL